MCGINSRHYLLPTLEYRQVNSSVKLIPVFFHAAGLPSLRGGTPTAAETTAASHARRLAAPLLAGMYRHVGPDHSGRGRLRARTQSWYRRAATTRIFRRSRCWKKSWKRFKALGTGR